MNNVPFNFRQSVASLLREPKTEKQRASFVFTDPLWTETLQTAWEKREYMTLILCKQQSSPWQYGFKYRSIDALRPVSSEVISNYPNLAHLRIGKIEIVDKMHFTENQLFAVKTSLAAFVDALRVMIPWPVPALPDPVDTPPVLNISGEYDEATEIEIGNVFSRIKFATVSTSTYEPAFDPILEAHLRNNRVSDRFYFYFSDLRSSTMKIMRRHFREAKILSRLEMYDNQPFSFDDFEAIFQTLLEMPFNWDEVPEDSPYLHTVLDAGFQRGAYNKLINFWPSLLDNSAKFQNNQDGLRWRKDENTCIQVNCGGGAFCSWRIRLVRARDS